MRTLFYNCPAGICGDMHLGAMVDLGVEPAALTAQLEKLGLSGWKIAFEKDRRKGISGTRCDIRLDNADAEHHSHRTFKDIRILIEKAPLNDRVKADAIAVFKALAEAEGAVHGKPAEAIHFHEVGAVDSILDIVGAAVCWDLLDIDQIAASRIELGGGTVSCAHGVMPVPAPATARLVENMPVTIGGSGKEATTPTGAALLAGRQCRFGQPVCGKSLASGIGIGQRDDPDLANVLYVSLLESGEAGSGAEEVVEMAVNLDDMSPEHVAFLAECLMEAGALDVWQVSATFKKGRLGCVLNILGRPEDRDKLAALVFRHSTTLGFRWSTRHRQILDRTSRKIATPDGPARLKTSGGHGVKARAKWEFDDLSRIAREKGLTIGEVEENLRDHKPGES